ncbi:hypothetical protein ABC383_22305 [Noviherbaspirillum sp. 1P10PC]|uniref:hypothetical protein n=1 Tax=Noviherbaspirillum sp. 1P10PC TaxID=3132292 RepID=UPI00399F4AA2
MSAVYKSIFASRQSDSLLDRLLVRLDQSDDSAQWKEYRAAALGLNNPTSAARKLRVSPGRVTSLIKSGSVRLYPVNNQYRYVKVKEVAQALQTEQALHETAPAGMPAQQG